MLAIVLLMLVLGVNILFSRRCFEIIFLEICIYWPTHLWKYNTNIQVLVHFKSLIFLNFFSTLHIVVRHQKLTGLVKDNFRYISCTFVSWDFTSLSYFINVIFSQNSSILIFIWQQKKTHIIWYHIPNWIFFLSLLWWILITSVFGAYFFGLLTYYKINSSW